MTRALDRLLRPASIAVIGGGAWGANIVTQCRKIGFTGQIHVVHPKKAQVAGIATVPAITDLPAPPDAAFVGVNRSLTIDAVAQLSAMGAGGAVCFASGFKEASAELSDGSDLQDALLLAAGEMPILGPNCYGFINALDGATLWPDQHGAARVDSGVAIVTQSSNIAINLTMQSRGLPMAYVVTAGNQAQTGLAEIGQALLEDPRVTALGLHIEGIGDLRAFEALALRAHEVGKPIVALKVGQSDQARAATVSHTASLAGQAAGAHALFDRLGVARVADLSSFLETLKLLHVVGPLASNRIGSMSCSGGEASLMADSALGLDLTYPALNDAQSEQLRSALGPAVALANPLDYHTYIWADLQAMQATFTAMMAGDLGLGVVVLDFPRPDRCDGAAWDIVIDAIAGAQSTSGKPVALLASLPDTLPEEVAQRCIARGILPLCDMRPALKAMEQAAWLGSNPPEGEALCLLGTPQGVATLSEAEAKAALARHGVPIPQGARARIAPDAVEAAEQLGYPVVLKSEGAAHKTEAGGVALNLRSVQDVQQAADKMGRGPFLVEQMIPVARAELLVGILRDPAHGFVMTLGAGGTLTELWQDTACLLLPASRAQINAALNSLRIAPLLRGYRGALAVDRPALIDAILHLQDYALAHADQLEELEVNPLIASETGAFAVDALIRIGTAPHPDPTIAQQKEKPCR
ncbi:MAG: acetate--CoA ligase family protein [Pelagimonas sp.]|jgi:acyl-CoA synthetase (NDP forming)|nr:acetate--CoA ligase family protein [Pelagimonas sp.]